MEKPLMDNNVPAQPAYPGPSPMRAAPGHGGRVWESYCRRSSAFPAV